MEKGTSEIVKLTERISKDPKSKLFVPLAEEYKKIGDVEMAIHVLSEGLKQNPTYVTARSLLGRLLFENGDFVAAQKEFEEVVKAIPDNLLGRKKLGDLYLRQNNKEEALKQYRIALSLNPGDKAFAMQVSDLEAQHRENTDVEPKVAGTVKAPDPAGKSEKQTAPDKKPNDSTESAQPELKQSKPESTTARPSVPVSKSEQQETLFDVLKGSRESAPEQNRETTAMPSSIETAKQAVPVVLDRNLVADKESEKTNILAEPVQQVVNEALPLEPDEPEDILVVEPLDVEQQAAPPSESFFEETESIKSDSLAVGKREEIAPIDAEIIPVSDDDVVLTDLPAADAEIPADSSGLFGSVPHLADEVTDRKTVLNEEPKAGERASSEIGQALFDELRETEPDDSSPKEKPSNESDDFTTDTLAELYIAQGFYEKAIDIYQRMLADRPDSVGLQNKLTRVRAMAAPSEEMPSSSGVRDAVREETPLSPLDEEVIASEPVAGEAREAEEKLDALPAVRDDAASSERAGNDKEKELKFVVEPKKEEEEITIEAELLIEPDEVEALAPPLGAKEGTISAPRDREGATVREKQPLPPTDEPSVDIFTEQGVQQAAETNPVYPDFEPQEYVPPDAALRPVKEPLETAVPHQQAAGKKETIDRLEKWLTTIMKEK